MINHHFFPILEKLVIFKFLFIGNLLFKNEFFILYKFKISNLIYNKLNIYTKYIYYKKLNQLITEKKILILGIISSR